MIFHKESKPKICVFGVGWGWGGGGEGGNWGGRGSVAMVSDFFLQRIQI